MRDRQEKDQLLTCRAKKNLFVDLKFKESYRKDRDREKEEEEPRCQREINMKQNSCVIITGNQSLCGRSLHSHVTSTAKRVKSTQSVTQWPKNLTKLICRIDLNDSYWKIRPRNNNRSFSTSISHFPLSLSLPLSPSLASLSLIILSPSPACSPSFAIIILLPLFHSLTLSISTNFL